MTKSKTKLQKVNRKGSVSRAVIKKAVEKAFGENENKADEIKYVPNKTHKIMLTKSKTKLIKVERKFSVKRSVVEKAAREVYEALGFEVPEKNKISRSSKSDK